MLDHQDERELRLVRWGLVPFWAKDVKGGARLINARAETVAVKPAFRAAFAQRRCLIPADGYYEWQTGAGLEGQAAVLHLPDRRRHPRLRRPLRAVEEPRGAGRSRGRLVLVGDDHHDRRDRRDRQDPRPDADGDRAGRLGGLARPGQPGEGAPADDHAPGDVLRARRPDRPPGLDRPSTPSATTAPHRGGVISRGDPPETPRLGGCRPPNLPGAPPQKRGGPGRCVDLGRRNHS